MKNYKVYGNENTHLSLSEKAQLIYNATDPLEIKEYETENGYLYSISGAIEVEELTEKEVNDCILSLNTTRENEAEELNFLERKTYINGYWFSVGQLELLCNLLKAQNTADRLEQGCYNYDDFTIEVYKTGDIEIVG